MNNLSLRYNFACFSAMFLWAFGFPAVEVLLESWGSLTLVFFRFFITILILIPFWLFMEGVKIIQKAPIFKSIIIGFIGWGLGGNLLIVGQKLSDPVTTAICAAMMPIFGAIVELIYDRRKITSNIVIGISLAVFGGYLATGVKFSDGKFGLGAIICIVAVILFAWGTRASTKGLSNLTYLGQSALTMTGGTIASLVFCLVSLIFGLSETKVGNFDYYHIILLLIFVLVSQTISQTIWIFGSGKLGVLLASLHSNGLPFYVMLIYVIFFGGSWNWMQALGAFIVGVGVIVAQIRK